MAIARRAARPAPADLDTRARILAAATEVFVRRGIEVPAGQTLDGVRIQLLKHAAIQGRVELAGFGEKPNWIGMSIQRFDPRVTDPARAWDQQECWENADEDGSFTINSAPPGRYRIRFYTNNQHDAEWWAQGELEIGNQDMTGIVLVPVKVERPGQKR